MKQITLTILKEDILLDNYVSSDECPITKALHRAGQLGLKDRGYIQGKDNDGEYIRLGDENKSYEELLTKLFGMYKLVSNDKGYRVLGKDVKSIPIETFVHTLIY